jgi:hypothetical protein
MRGKRVLALHGPLIYRQGFLSLPHRSRKCQSHTPATHSRWFNYDLQPSGLETRS